MAFVRTFDPSTDDPHAFYPGVPKGDIDEETWNSYPAWLQESVDKWDDVTGQAPMPTYVEIEEP